MWNYVIIAKNRISAKYSIPTFLVDIDDLLTNLFEQSLKRVLLD